jgi:transposase
MGWTPGSGLRRWSPGWWRKSSASSTILGTGIATFIPALKKAHTENRALIFTDEAGFRQDSTLHATWSRLGHPPEIPATGERKSVKILSAVELWTARFHYGQTTVFNASTYLDFLHRLAPPYRRRGAILIQDNASYHKDSEVWSWFKSNRHWLEVHQLPPYSPELNPTERLWQYTRKTGTHDRYFASQGELVGTLTRVFGGYAILPWADPT